MKQDFENAVEECAQKAADESNKMDSPGDPATHVTAYVDGRTKFVQDMKKHADKIGRKSMNFDQSPSKMVTTDTL